MVGILPMGSLFSRGLIRLKEILSGPGPDLMIVCSASLALDVVLSQVILLTASQHVLSPVHCLMQLAKTGLRPRFLGTIDNDPTDILGCKLCPMHSRIFSNILDLNPVYTSRTLTPSCDN